MNVTKAFAVWRAAQKLDKDCEKKGCKPCKMMFQTLIEIGVGVDILKHFGYYENKTLNLSSLDPNKEQQYKNHEKWDEWSRIVKSRLDMIEGDKANEELPAELSEVFEELERRMKKHPPIKN